MKSLKKDFVDGAVSHGGQNRSVISKLFNRLEEFARYSFNKSHAVAYAYISYQTAWLKSNYTAEYMAASISCEPDTEQQSLYMADAKRNGVDILPPDVNASGKDFVVNSDGKILFGFNSIKGMGERAIERVISLQPYDSFGLFLILTYHAKGVNRKVIDALIYSGACDSFGYKRSGLVIAFESFLADYVSLVGTAKLDLIVAKKFCLEEARYFDVEGTEELPMLTILDYEKDLLGLHVSGNPFDIISQIVREELTPLADYERIKNGTVYSLCLVDTFKKIVTKKGKRMGFLDLSDREGDSASVVVFPNTFEEVGDSITAGIYLVVGVLIKTDDRGKNFILNSAQDLTAAIRKVSEQVEESKSVKNIDLVMGDCSTVRMRSLRKKIDHYVTSEDLGYKATVVVPLNGFDFKIKEFNIQPINISMLREFSRLSGLIVRRR